MTARPLTEVVREVEEAIDDGDYAAAVDTARHVLGQFPEFATAHRLLGDAYLEQHDLIAAERAYTDTLQRDPQSATAYAGLGAIAEERGDLDAALSYTQAAWEIAPERVELRDRVVRLAQQCYGSDGRLHLTRAALASLHAGAGRWSRVIFECAAVLAEQPDRVDVQLRLAEALWRRGDDGRAADVCRSVLRQAPMAVGALLILADIERRAGNEASARALLNQARAIDADGVRAADLITVDHGDGASFLRLSDMPVLRDDQPVAPRPPQPRYEPAPDFLMPSVPESANMVPAPMTETTRPGLPLPSDEEIEAARPSSESQTGYTEMLESLEVEGITPFHFDEPGEQAEASAPVDDEDIESLLSLASDEEIEAARPPESEPRGFTGYFQTLDESGIAPFDLLEVDDEGDWLSDVHTDTAAEPKTEDRPWVDSGTSGAGDIFSDWDALEADLREAAPFDETSDQPSGEPVVVEELGLFFVFFFFFWWPFDIGLTLEPENGVVVEDDQEDLFESMWRVEERDVDIQKTTVENAPAVPLPMEAPEDVSSGDLSGSEPEPIESAAEAESQVDLVRDAGEVTVEGVVPAEDIGTGSTPAVGGPLAEPELDRVRALMTRVGFRAELFDLARAAKARLVEEGRIDGTLLPGVEPPGPTIEELEAALGAEPDNAEVRLALAAALAKAGDVARALDHYHRLFHSGIDLTPQLPELIALVDGGSAAVRMDGHRLIGAMCRQAGDTRVASSHYRASLEAYLEYRAAEESGA